MTDTAKGAIPTGDQRPSRKLHELKVWPEFFKWVWSGDKLFELRKDDRGFRAGDSLRLREYIPREDRYTDRVINTQIMFVLSGFPGLLPSYVIIGFDPRETVKGIGVQSSPDRSEASQAPQSP